MPDAARRHALDSRLRPATYGAFLHAVPRHFWTVASHQLVHFPTCLLTRGAALRDRFDAVSLHPVQLGTGHATVDQSRCALGFAPRLSDGTRQEQNPSQNGYPGLRLHPEFPQRLAVIETDNEPVTNNGPVVVYRIRKRALFSTSLKLCRVHASGKVSLDFQVVRGIIPAGAYGLNRTSCRMAESEISSRSSSVMSCGAVS